MNRNAKIAIGVVIGLVIFYFLFILYQLRLEGLGGVSANPKQIRKVVTGIFDYELPAGFREQMISYEAPPDFKEQNQPSGVFVDIVGGAPGNLIRIWQKYANGDSEIEQKRDVLARAVRTMPAEWQKVDERVMTIRGQEVLVRTYTGKLSEIGKSRVTTEPFRTKSGIAVILITTAEPDFSFEKIDAFLSSIK